ncbi:MAG TPA: hypothetical protein VH391_01140 [Solirubrobacterales bacterium]|jgi:hypothetical protein
MSHGRNDLGQQVISGVDLMIDFATLGEYGLEPRPGAGSCRERPDRRPRPSRRPGWEALATARRGACATSSPPRAPGPRETATAREATYDFRFPDGARRADFRSAVARYAA